MTTTTTAPTERDQAYFDIFVTAMEGGIGYWSLCTAYRWTTNGELDGQDTIGFYAVIRDAEEEWFDSTLPTTTIVDAPSRQVRIDRALIASGIRKFIAWAKEADSINPYFQRAAVALDWGKWDELDVDADIADAIVQFGIFGEVVFG